MKFSRDKIAGHGKNTLYAEVWGVRGRLAWRRWIPFWERVINGLKPDRSERTSERSVFGGGVRAGSGIKWRKGVFNRSQRTGVRWGGFFFWRWDGFYLDFLHFEIIRGEERKKNEFRKYRSHSPQREGEKLIIHSHSPHKKLLKYCLIE